MDEEAWQKFERRMLSSAKAISAFRACKYHDSTPALLHQSLCTIEKAIQITLQALIPLELSHREQQDLEIEPFNFPLVNELASARLHLEVIRKRGLIAPDFVVPLYPTKLVADLAELRDVARYAAKQIKPRRGQSADRDPVARDASRLARDFVFWYRATFGQMPPMSKTGRVVDLLQSCLSDAGLAEADAARLLQTAIERDALRGELPSARPTRTKRVK